MTLFLTLVHFVIPLAVLGSGVTWFVHRLFERAARRMAQ